MIKRGFSQSAQLMVFCLSLVGLSGASSQSLNHFKLSCAQGQTAKACLNQTVSLDAQMAGVQTNRQDEILQHPILTTPFDEPPLNQQYTQISANLGQVIVLSPQAINCQKVTLKGLFTQHQEQCSEGDGGKCKYTNYVLRISSFKCLK